MSIFLQKLKLLSDYKHDLQKEFKGYNLHTFMADLLAGVTVAAVALPLALAFGVSNGADAAAGLITAIVAAFIIGSLSGSSFQISGPTGAMGAVLIATAVKYGLETVLMAGFISGFILILAGVLRLGSLVSFIPRAVITGFTSGIAVVIALGQVENFVGLKSHGEEALVRLINLFTLGQLPNFYALAIGLFVAIFILFWPAKFNKIVPASLLSLFIVTVINLLFKMPVDTVGLIPKALIHDTRLTFFSFFGVKWDVVLLASISISALGIIETLLCGTVAGKMKGERMNNNRELVAQGVGNLVLPFMGGVPATAAIARTSVGIKSGGRTRLTGIIHGLVLLLSMFLLAPLMSQIPLSALAGVLMVTAYRMNEWKAIHYIFGKKFASAIAGFCITLLCTVVFDLTIAIVVGCLLTMVLFIRKLAQVYVAVTPLENQPSTQLITLMGSLFFASVGKFEEKISEINGDTFIFLMQTTSMVDTSGVQSILEFCEEKKASGTKVLFCGLQPNVKTLFDKADVSHLVGQDSFFETLEQATKSLEV